MLAGMMQSEANRYAAADRLKLGRPEYKDAEIVREAIRKQAFESAFAWDRNGKLVAARDGNKTEVFLLDSEWGVLNGGYLLHNHPEKTPFSTIDLNLAHANRVARMEAVTSGYLYIVEPHATGWEVVSDVVWKEERGILHQKFVDIRRERKRGTISEREEKDAMHEALKNFRQHAYIRYGRIEG